MYWTVILSIFAAGVGMTLDAIERKQLAHEKGLKKLLGVGCPDCGAEHGARPEEFGK